MRIQHVEPGMILAQDIVDEKGILLLEKGIALTELYIRRLEKIGIMQLRIADPQADLLKKNKIIPDELRAELDLCFRALFSLQTSRIMNPKLTKLYLHQVSRSLETVIEETDKHLVSILDTQIRQPTEDDVSHSVNVCLMSVITGLALGLSRSSLHDLAVGALLHDIGKALSIQHSDNTSHTSDLHTLHGRNLLLQNNLNATIARIAAEHHETYDGSGFPKSLKQDQIHPLSKIVCIANYFDNAMAQAAANGTLFQEIIENMMAKGNTLFDLTTLKAFVGNIPVYPIGCFIRLSTGKTGHVIKNQPHYPLHPIIRLSFMPYEEINLISNPTITIQEIIEE